LPHRAGHLLTRTVPRTGEVMVLEDPGQPAGDIGTRRTTRVDDAPQLRTCSANGSVRSGCWPRRLLQVCDDVSIIDKGEIVVTGTLDEARGGNTLQRAFIDLVGPSAADEEVLSWLGSSSS
jgi:ABC-type Na+ transport system ATPase subunit NatA